MSGKIMKGPAAIPSTDLGDAKQVPYPLGDVVSEVRMLETAHFQGHSGQVTSGIWECTPGEWERTITAAEFAHFLKGSCTFEGDDGQILKFEAGDSVLFKPNSLGRWIVHETTRKVFVLFES